LGPVSDPDGQAFYFSVCSLGSNTSSCPGSHVCVRQGNVVTSNGHTVGFYPIVNSTGPQYFYLYFDDGDDGNHCVDGSQRSTKINFECNTESATTLPTFVDTDENCTSYFTWRTQVACPLCVDSDYAIEEGGCDGSQKSITKVRLHDCNGQERIAQPSQDCEIPVAFPLAALLVPLIAFVVLLVAAIFMFIRHRNITKKYSLLLSGNSSRPQSVEMSAPLHLRSGSIDSPNL